MVELQPSGGEKPVSVTVNRGVLYALHSGEATDDLFDSEGVANPNCPTGTPSITGFTVTARGCAQISFTPDGDVLLATERTANDEGPPGPDGDEGVIVTFKRSASGLLHGKTITDATGEGPFP
ncbi:hypothetical protein BH20CHL5_BH20CHL5_09600 [soil metagenome]